MDKKVGGRLVDLIVPCEEPKEPKCAGLKTVCRGTRLPHGGQQGVVILDQLCRLLRGIETTKVSMVKALIA